MRTVACECVYMRNEVHWGNCCVLHHRLKCLFARCSCFWLRFGDSYLVLNAGCKDKDMAHLNVQLAAFQKKGGDCQITEMKQHALVALQVWCHWG